MGFLRNNLNQRGQSNLIQRYCSRIRKPNYSDPFGFSGNDVKHSSDRRQKVSSPARTTGIAALFSVRLKDARKLADINGPSWFLYVW